KAPGINRRTTPARPHPRLRTRRRQRPVAPSAQTRTRARVAPALSRARHTRRLPAMPADAALLAGVPFFQYLEAGEREVLSRRLDVVRIAAGEIVFHANDPGGTLFVIREGSVEVFFKNDTGERIV